MIQIKELVKAMRDELKDAEAYIDKALQYKASEKNLADMYKDIAQQEIKHAHMEHDQAVRIIEKVKQTGMKIPEAMQTVWDWEHEELIEHEALIKMKIDMYG